MVSALKPGMILSKPVFNAHHQRLADAETVLDTRVINVLQTWGIIEVEIQGATDLSLDEIEERMATIPALHELSVKIDERFYGADTHAFIYELRRLVKQLALAEAQV
ncbi:MAG: hypothetical protein AB7P18_11890 [Candidatus Binatia bacterium]